LDRLGEGAMIVAGGHSLLPMMKLRIANPEYLIDINDLHGELSYIEVTPTQARLGAMARHAEVLASADLLRAAPIFADAEWVIADPVVRNRGTVGGSLCQADPAEDLSTVCEILGATVLVRGPKGQREIGIDDFHVGAYETSRDHNEILIEVRIPLRPNSSSAYYKVERRVGDWAVAAAGATVTLDGDRIAEGRVGLTAVNADHDGLVAVREALAGAPATEETFAEAGRLAALACEPVTDQRGTEAYKRHLAAELTTRTLRTAVERVRANA
ncbi:xanthine dehydrogenase family protein subunit M, partial [Mycolicibacterium sp.]|uniref:FAD binding domain-containing protein n=1 Tax=Mycolicibacterium sp. TaxID=2320850 RepID=UPI001A315CD2